LFDLVFSISPPEQLITNGLIPWLSALFAICLAIIHIYSGKLRFIDTIPRSRWLSMASGVSVAYVFVHILPDLSIRQRVIAQTGIFTFIEHHVYLIALFGLTVFYGLERVVRESRKIQEKLGKDTPEVGVFWLHIISFSLYNGLIGYLLLHREEPGIQSLFLFFMAMALHFVVNDYGLRQHHKHIYHTQGRWILAVAIIVGWAIGYGTEIDQAAIAVLFAFLAGGVILNVLKEELPEERKSCFWAFAMGTGAYTLLLLTL
jgi:zinc transporter ZupT